MSFGRGSWSRAPPGHGRPRRDLSPHQTESRGRRVVAFLSVAGLIALDLRYSWVESCVLSALARSDTVAVGLGKSPALAPSGRGPYDARLGYEQLDALVNRLSARGFAVDAQARSSGTALALARLGIFPIYHEKNQAGLRILDRQGRPLRDIRFPQEAYSDFEAIPPLVVNTLLFIENREMLDPSRPHRNPAIEWDRFSHAVAELSIHTVDRGHPLIGGSTLATQLEKMRHSPAGRTGSVSEKIRQMASASLRAYQDGRTRFQPKRKSFVPT